MFTDQPHLIFCHRQQEYFLIFPNPFTNSIMFCVWKNRQVPIQFKINGDFQMTRIYNENQYKKLPVTMKMWCSLRHAQDGSSYWMCIVVIDLLKL